MRWSPSLAFCLVVCLVSAVPAYPQEGTLIPSRSIVFPPSPGHLTADERRALDAWMDAMRKWQRAEKRWPNGPAHDAFGRVIQRAEQPDPPAWLEPRCAIFPAAMLATLDAPLGPACRVLAAIASDPAADSIRATTTATRTAAEKLVKNTFLTRIHLDGLWTTTSTDYRLYGLVGSHISLVDVGRVQFFGPPGVILLSVPDATGSRAIRVGYTWGLSVRLKDVRLFSPTSNMTLFLTVTRVWVSGGTPYDRMTPGGYDIAGFSLAPRKHAE